MPRDNLSKNLNKTVQTLIAPRRDLTNKENKENKDHKEGKVKSGEKASKQAKRTLSDVEKSEESDNSMNLSSDFSDNIKKDDLTKALENLVKQSDIEQIVTNIVEKLLGTLKNEIKKEVNDKVTEITNKQNTEIQLLKSQNSTLSNQLEEQNIRLNSITIEMEDTMNKSYSALSMANYNEQYSRKFNIKMVNFQTENDENLRESFLKTVKDDLNLKLEKRDIVAIHRLRSYKSGVPPVIVKVVNSEVKTAIMRKKKQMKNHVKLYDDITIKNRDLLKGLRHHKDIDVAYYYNGSVFRKTKDLQIIFDIFDDISYRIEYERTKDVNNENGES
ncbi:unnamed protein product [Mytilus edulis]|uniref:Uncharacterized protein n=1 Tax=Mytilus edulis TaxID=6550 RepID=A0A8S3TKX1_MYTED|nr:unnamed protein product [Mytilus edulis]